MRIESKVLPFLIMMVIFGLAFGFKKKSLYTGYFYPDGNNLKESIETGKYDSLKDCQQSIEGLMKYHNLSTKNILSREESLVMKDFIRALGKTHIENKHPSKEYLVFRSLEKVGFNLDTGEYEREETVPDGECGYKCRFNPSLELNVCKKTYDIK